MRQHFLIRLAAMFAATAALVAISLVFFAKSAVIVSFWPANALMLAFLLRAFHTRQERALATAAGFVALAGTSLMLRGSPLAAIGFSVANTVEVVAAAWLLRGLKLPINDGKSLFELVVSCVLAAPLISSIFAGLTTAIMARPSGFTAGALQWFVSDAVGMAVFAPVFLSISLDKPFAALRSRALAPAIGAQLLVLTASLALFFVAHHPLIFALSPMVILAVWTGRAPGGALAVAQIAVIGSFSTALGYGPIVHAEPDISMRVLGLQLFLAAQILTVHPLAMALAKLDGYAKTAHSLRREAERRSDVRAKLLAHVSHEIRSPLSGVMGLAELMKNGAMGDLTDAQKEGMSQITDCAADMQALASDLLDAAAVQSGRMNVSLADVEITDAMYQAIAGARFRTREYAPRIELTGDWSGRLLVSADPQRLKQVLINLMVNAAKYGGRPPRIEIGARVIGDRVRIEVCDNGPGVPQVLREALFRPFERLGAEKTDVEGSGLGLAVARELMQLQNGTIGVDDGPMGGARFYIELNRASLAAVAA
ncbi:MAG TPA: ATP-binding protein [Caulobacteraceae bacterium]|jgi:signal transduction histidine kinase|nr:ATP-binding protein [Caulobacteraceae bacterium]